MKIPRHTPKPEVTLENYKAVYEYYDGHLPARWRTRLGQWGMSHVQKPSEIKFLDASKKKTGEYLKEGGQVLWIANHTSGLDPVTIASTLRREPVLRPIRDRLTGIVKIDLLPSAHPEFSKAGIKSLANPIQRWAIESMRSMPVFRAKDIVEHEGRDPTPEELRRLQLAGLPFMRVVSHRLKEGESIGMFPTGERNREDPTVLPPFEDGMAFIARKGYATTNGKLRILPSAIWYPEGDEHHPHVIIGDMINPEGMKDERINTVAHEAVKWCLEFAQEL